MKFQIGQLVATRRINDDMAKDKVFANEITMCLTRFKNCDWGDTSDNDKMLNDDAAASGDRILAAYETTKGRIWILTEQGGMVTTVLYPDEY